MARQLAKDLKSSGFCDHFAPHQFALISEKMPATFEGVIYQKVAVRELFDKTQFISGVIYQEQTFWKLFNKNRFISWVKYQKPVRKNPDSFWGPEPGFHIKLFHKTWFMSEGHIPEAGFQLFLPQNSNSFLESYNRSRLTESCLTILYTEFISGVICSEGFQKVVQQNSCLGSCAWVIVTQAHDLITRAHGF